MRPEETPWLFRGSDNLLHHLSGTFVHFMWLVRIACAYPFILQPHLLHPYFWFFYIINVLTGAVFLKTMALQVNLPCFCYASKCMLWTWLQHLTVWKLLCRILRKGIGGCSSVMTMCWVIGLPSYSPTWRTVLQWLSGEVRLWIQNQMVITLTLKWAVAVSPKKVLANLVISGTYRLLMTPIIWRLPKGLAPLQNNQTAMMYKQGATGIGAITFIMGALVKTPIVLKSKREKHLFLFGFVFSTLVPVYHSNPSVLSPLLYLFGFYY